MSNSLTFIFFIYGLAFFSMGLALFLESGRSPFLAEGRILLPLAIFGLVHGSHEWLEMFTYQQTNLPDLVLGARLLMLVVSFSLLVLFGLQSFVSQPRMARFALPVLAGILVFFMVMLFLDFFLHSHKQFYQATGHVDALARYLLGIPGALIASAALGVQASQARKAGRMPLSYSLWAASLSFLVYGFTQVFVPAQDFFPANIINSSFFYEMTGVPIQVIRAGVAIAVLFGLLRAVQIADQSRQQQLQEAQQARLAALEVAQYEMHQRENLRRDLIRHTVLAQEEERARIARELHDETAQLITAINLHLASLKRAQGNSQVMDAQIDQLNKLGQQMSDGIYRLVHDLRPAQLDDLGLVAAIQYLVDDFRHTHGLDVKLVVNGARKRVDSLVETVIFRVTQESLSNIVRHAGILSARASLSFTPERIVLEVKDEGRGFNVKDVFIPPHGYGIAGMRERVEAVAGEFEVQSIPGQGTVVRTTIPLLQEKQVLVPGGKLINESSVSLGGKV